VTALVHLLRLFNAVFGLTQAKPQEERKWAVYLFVLLLLLLGMIAGSAALIIKIFG
jgi:hypothetical protein